MNFSICSFNNSQVTGVIYNLPEHNFDFWPESGWRESLVLCPEPAARGFWLFHSWSDFILIVTLGIGHNCHGFTPEKTRNYVCHTWSFWKGERRKSHSFFPPSRLTLCWLMGGGTTSFQGVFLLFYFPFLHNHVPVRKFSLQTVTFQKLCRLCFQSLSCFRCWLRFLEGLCVGLSPHPWAELTGSWSVSFSSASCAQAFET